MTQGFIKDEAPHGHAQKPHVKAKSVPKRYESRYLAGEATAWFPGIHVDGVVEDLETKTAMVVNMGDPFPIEPGDILFMGDDNELRFYDRGIFDDHYQEIDPILDGITTKVLFQVRAIVGESLTPEAKSHAMRHPMVSGDGAVLGDDVDGMTYINALTTELINTVLAYHGISLLQDPEQEPSPSMKSVMDTIRGAVDTAVSKSS